MGAGPPGTGSWTRTMRSHAGTRNSGDHTGTSVGATLAGVAPRSTAGSVGHTRRTGRTSPTRRETPAPSAWARDIRSSPILADRTRKDVPAGNGVVRMILWVGEGGQGAKTRRSGDACDSLYLWGTDAGALARHTWDWGTGWSWRVTDIRAVPAADNWDLASGPAVAHARRRWPVGRVAYTWTVRPVAPACLRCSVDGDKPCAPARRLAPVTRRA